MAQTQTSSRPIGFAHGGTSSLLAGLLLLSLAGCQSAPAPSKAQLRPPEQAVASAVAPRLVDVLKDRSVSVFYVGKGQVMAGQVECARGSFDESLAVLGSEAVPANDLPELLDFADELVASIESYERFANQDGREEERREVDAPHLETLAVVDTESTPREELDRSLSSVAGEDLTAFSVDLPINDRVLALVAQYQGPLRSFFSAALARSGRYLPLFEQIFREEGLPPELAYMALVESAFKVNAHSPARAHGLWQFIPSTGRLYGLRSDGWVDERSDPEKSTRAAARYLKYLHLMFDDWHLAMAAYNAGEGKVLRAIRRSGRTDFWSLSETRHLMRETRNYVPAILAGMLIGADPARFGFVIDKEPPLDFDRIELDSPVDTSVVAETIGVDLESIRDLNPELRTQWTPFGERSYSLRVPRGTAEAASAGLARLSEAERLRMRPHLVEPKQTLASIARRYGVSAASLRLANGLGPKSRIVPGSTLLVPPAGIRAPGDNPVRGLASSKSIRTRRGDTLSRVARRFGVSLETLAAANGLSPKSRLHRGQRLHLPAGGERNVTTVAQNRSKSHRRPSDSIRYAVRKGDTLSSIASAHGTTVRELRRWNQLNHRRRLHPGQTLTLYATGR
jgi:membrane-bound lytic murein transglycosylase D